MGGFTRSEMSPRSERRSHKREAVVSVLLVDPADIFFAQDERTSSRRREEERADVWQKEDSYGSGILQGGQGKHQGERMSLGAGRARDFAAEGV